MRIPGGGPEGPGHLPSLPPLPPAPVKPSGSMMIHSTGYERLFSSSCFRLRVISLAVYLRELGRAVGRGWSSAPGWGHYWERPHDQRGCCRGGEL